VRRIYNKMFFIYMWWHQDISDAPDCGTGTIPNVPKSKRHVFGQCGKGGINLQWDDKW
jgi:hypothetical protein